MLPKKSGTASGGGVVSSVHRNSSHAAAGYVGVALVLAGAMMLTPLIALLAFPEETALAPYFIFPSVGTMLVGYLVYYFGAKGAAAMTLTRVEAAGVTTLIWVLAVVVYAIPLVLSGILGIQRPFRVHKRPDHDRVHGSGRRFVSEAVLAAPQPDALRCGVGLILVLACVVSDAHG